MKKAASLQIISLVLIMAMAGCSTYRSVDIHHESTKTTPVYLTEPSLWEGDVVRYTLKDGRKGETVVQSVNFHTLTGKNGEQVSLSQIASLERKKTSGEKTSAATAPEMGIWSITLVTMLSVGLATALLNSDNG